MKNKRLKELKEVKAETLRFLKKLDEAIDCEPEDDHGYHLGPSKKWASVKRSALDMKTELSRITTFEWYK